VPDDKDHSFHIEALSPMPFLDWVNKHQAKQTSTEVPYRVLEFQSTHGDPSAENLLIRGDNLEALKALLPFYAGLVKCIYIDPPYNTQSAFEHYDDKLEHSQWLSMMYPRLVLLRDLLAENGSIWVSIDDNEGHYLKALMDEVFCRTNFITSIVWQKKYAKQNDSLWFSTSHDYIIVYGKNAKCWRPNKVPRNDQQLKGYKNPDGDHRGSWQSVVYTCSKSRSERPNLYYPITHPKTGQEIWPSETRVWAYDKAKHLQHVAENKMWWGQNQEKDKPRFKSFLNDVGDGVVPDTLWLRDIAGDNQDSKREGLALFGAETFATPKPEKLIQQILAIATNQNDIVLDSFLGSGTTAAVAHKMGRRYISIEMGEHAKTHCLPRLQKVIEGEQGGISKAVEWQGGGGFRFYTLGEPVFLADGGINDKIRFGTLAAYLWHFETGQPAGQAFDSPLLGVHEGTAYYLLYNGILGDRRPDGGNVLTGAVFAWLREQFPHEGPKVIYGETTRLGETRQKAENFVFKQIPYDIRAR
jgi:adenine-specific DNA-methyltransferase